jgi:integral membrane sensor domain MASE1
MIGGVTIVTDLENITVGDMMLRNGKRVVHTDVKAMAAQWIVTAFNFLKGEWFLNLNEGTPWLTVLNQKGNEDQVRVLVTQVVLRCPYVTAMVGPVLLTDMGDRYSRVEFTAALNDGTRITLAPFIVGE